MKYQHIDPTEAVKMMKAVKARKAAPIHWGTFPLTTEAILEPKERLVHEIQAAGLDAGDFPAWRVGETVEANVGNEK